MKSHIIFTSNGKDAITDDKQQHRLRRAKGKTLFNEAWRDLLLAFLQALKNREGYIGCYVGYDNLYVEICDIPQTYRCDYDYLDPNTPMTEKSVDTYITDEENDEE